VVLGIARGGVIVAKAVADELGTPLDVIVIRKVGHPLQRELALGAVSASGESVVTQYAADLPLEVLTALFEAQAQGARRMETSLRHDAPPLELQGRCAIVVDDGIATSATMECAIAHVRRAEAARVVCAAPVAPLESVEHLRPLCDRIAVVVVAREREFAVGRYYVDFGEVGDAQVLAALAPA